MEDHFDLPASTVRTPAIVSVGSLRFTGVNSSDYHGGEGEGHAGLIELTIWRGHREQSVNAR